MSIDTSRNYWLVGASWGGEEDKSQDLLKQRIWRFWPGPDRKNPYKDKIQSMRPGDRIAIKSVYTRKHDLPFQNRGNSVSVMAIKAIGEITNNPGDGLSVEVDWQQSFETPREWYFYTGRTSVWKLKTDHWMAIALIRFAFEGKPQDIDQFIDDPYWSSRFRHPNAQSKEFLWTQYYEAFANRLVDFHNKREVLIEGIERLSKNEPKLNYLREEGSSRSSGFLEDICPFTFMGAFNRQMTTKHRRSLAADLGNLIGIDQKAPDSFEGIPVMNNQSSWFFGRRNLRKSDDIDGLWEIFKIALKFADAGEDGPNAQEFITKFDLTIAQFKVAWSLTIGLYWIRPWEYAPLDQNTRSFVASRFSLDIPKEIGPKGLDGLGYLELLENLRSRFSEPGVQVRSFPELSLAARSGDGALVDHLGDEAIDEEESPYAETATEYGIGNIVTEGCFVPKSDLKQILDRLRDKKNIILQGPPGTGKTWLSKKLAFALMEQRDGKRLTAVQFHPTLSYEDFVRGWRPTASGQLSLVDGPLMLAVQKAADKPGNKYVVVIEEINRGNPAQIFGEMLTLMEKDKRNPESGLSLSHMKEDEPPIYLPDNLYLIGTMNIADRSLALVDLALRRRFAFIDLTPQFNSAWARWLKTEGGIEPRLVEAIRERMVRLNKAITEDDALGSNLAVGHSYLTPGKDERIDEPLAWFRAVIDTEIGPLLEEYWFDRPERAKEEKDRLLAGW